MKIQASNKYQINYKCLVYMYGMVNINNSLKFTFKVRPNNFEGPKFVQKLELYLELSKNMHILRNKLCYQSK